MQSYIMGVCILIDVNRINNIRVRRRGKERYYLKNLCMIVVILVGSSFVWSCSEDRKFMKKTNRKGIEK